MENQDQQTENLLTAATEELYDLSILEEMDDNEYTVDILNIFLKDTPVELKEMKAALHEGNTETIAKKAHKIKGSSGIIQARGLCSMLDRVEKIAKTGTINDTLKSLVESIQQLYNITDRALKLHLQELK